MKESLQYKRTDKAIINAFITLCKQKSFDQITIKDILDEALVSRNTFYAHYKDKYEIAEMLFTQFIEAFQKNLDDIYKRDKVSIYSLQDENRVRELTHRHQKFFEETKDVSAVLAKIHTDQVDLLGAMEHYFYEKYLTDVALREKDDKRVPAMEAKIYAAIESALAKDGFDISGANPVLSSDPDDLSRSIINAALFAVGIRVPETQKELADLVMQRRQEAMINCDIS